MIILLYNIGQGQWVSLVRLWGGGGGGAVPPHPTSQAKQHFKPSQPPKPYCFIVLPTELPLCRKGVHVPACMECEKCVSMSIDWHVRKVCNSSVSYCKVWWHLLDDERYERPFEFLLMTTY